MFCVGTYVCECSDVYMDVCLKCVCVCVCVCVYVCVWIVIMLEYFSAAGDWESSCQQVFWYIQRHSCLSLTPYQSLCHHSLSLSPSLSLFLSLYQSFCYQSLSLSHSLPPSLSLSLQDVLFPVESVQLVGGY